MMHYQLTELLVAVVESQEPQQTYVARIEELISSHGVAPSSVLRFLTR